MITREIDYALRAILYLTKQADSEKTVITSKLAEDMDIPYRFLRKIINRLSKAGIVQSHRGKCGGVSLIRPSDKISLANVIEAIDSTAFKVNLCTDIGDCSRLMLCCLHSEMHDLQSMIDDKLGSIKFSDFINRPDSVDSKLQDSREETTDNER